MGLITENQVAIICPTKDRPHKVERLLLNICKFKTMPEQIIIADGGNNLKPYLNKFKNISNLTCVYCPQTGQVLQRNYARKYLLDKIKLVLHVDDDNTFEPNALSELLAFWNLEANKLDEKPLAGVSFNVIDLPKINNSLWRKIFFLDTKPEGTVSIAGYARPFAPAGENMGISWLLGGSTAWSREILDKYPHPIDFQTNWAICEDLIYSYPLSQSFRLSIAKEAIAYHNETYGEMSFNTAKFYGYSSVVMRHFFVTSNKNFSILAFIWMTFGIAFGHLFRMPPANERHAGILVGTIEGLIRIALNRLLKTPAKRTAEKLFLKKG